MHLAYTWSKVQLWLEMPKSYFIQLVHSIFSPYDYHPSLCIWSCSFTIKAHSYYTWRISRERIISGPTVSLSIHTDLHISDAYPIIAVGCIQRHLEITQRPTDIDRPWRFKTFLWTLPAGASRLWALPVTYDVNIFVKYMWEYFVAPLMVRFLSVSLQVQRIEVQSNLGSRT
jgi:hypothetical protein